jgi:hypothetical protein
MARVSIQPGVASLIGSAVSGARSEDHTFLLNGDLRQMSEQGAFLRNRGFSVEQNDVYPSLREEDVTPALRILWNEKVEGWWQYRTALVQRKICTEAQWKKALSVI